MVDAPAAAGERTILASPFPAAGGRVLVSPFQFLVTGEDNLRIEGWNTASGAALVVAYRFADLKGKIVANEFVLPLTADRLVAEQDFRLGEGYLVNMSVLVRGGAPRVGQTFCCIKLIRGLTGATMVLGLLAQGYVTEEQGIGWPGSPIADSISGGGYARTITGTNPAAGMELTETVPTGARWQLLGIRAHLIASAVVANRRPRLLFDNGASIWMQSNSVFTTPANGNDDYTWAAGGWIENVIGAGGVCGGIPVDAPLIAGSRMRTDTSGLDAGDNWGAPTYTVREWLEAD